MTPRLNIIGAGKLGRTLAKLWHDIGAFEIGEIVNQSVQSAENAINFIGTGRAVEEIESMSCTDVYLISVPDDIIADCAQRLLNAGTIKRGSILFHCSGALPSTVLTPVWVSSDIADLQFASVHPMRSFAKPVNAAKNFKGTYCAIEGDSNAVQLLGPAFEKIGGKLFSVNTETKTLYHAACCITSNYLTALMEFAARCFERSSVESDQALRIMQPLAQGTLNDIFSLGPTLALTGPIERGDVATVQRQLQVMKQQGKDIAELFSQLSKATLELSKQKGSASEASLTQLNKLLQEFPRDLIDTD